MIKTLVESGHVAFEHSRYRFLYNACDPLSVHTPPGALTGTLRADLPGLALNRKSDRGTSRCITGLGRDDTEIPLMTADIDRDRTGLADVQVPNDSGAVPDCFSTTPFPVNLDGGAHTYLALVSMKCDSPMGMDGSKGDVRSYHNVYDGNFARFAYYRAIS